MAPTRKVFYSFHYARDSWRVQQIKNMGVVEGQPLLTSNKWEEVKRKGKAAIERWIDDQMKGKSCIVVLIGRETASRPWVKYEIKKAWGAGKGVVGVNIHCMKGQTGVIDTRGASPFDGLRIGTTPFADIVKRHNPTGLTSKDVRASIEANLPGWVEEAITIRKRYR